MRCVYVCAYLRAGMCAGTVERKGDYVFLTRFWSLWKSGRFNGVCVCVQYKQSATNERFQTSGARDDQQYY